MKGALDFLAPSRARDWDGPRPVARSAAERLFRDADATFEERDGWLVATTVPGETARLEHVGVADLSHLGKLDVRPAPRLDGSLQQSVASASFRRLSPRRALVFFPEAARGAVAASLNGAGLVVDVTAAYTVLGVTGPEARPLLSRLTHLHAFPSGGDVAGVTAHVLPAGAGFRIVVAQELGEYLADVALDCASRLGGGLVGVDALPAEERP